MTREERDDGVFKYGMTDEALALIDKPTNDEPTIADYLCSLVDRPMRYLELGVSAGKTFYQVAARVTKFGGASCAFDIEKPSRALSSVTSFDGSTRYVQGDVMDSANWRIVGPRPFDLIFSDALHEPYALLVEYAMMRHHRLLADRVTIVWDDVETVAMRFSVEAIAADLSMAGWPASPRFTRLNGWLGQHEHKHMVGVVEAVR
jgi:hypothetical protein